MGNLDLARAGQSVVIRRPDNSLCFVDYGIHWFGRAGIPSAGGWLVSSVILVGVEFPAAAPVHKAIFSGSMAAWFYLVVE